MAVGISSSRDHARSLALDIPDDQRAQVRGAAHAVVGGLRVEVGDVLDGELDRHAALAFSSGPTGHGGKVVCFPSIGGADAESKGVGWWNHRKPSLHGSHGLD